MVFDTWLLGWIHQRGSPAQLMLAVTHLSLVVTHIISIQRSVDGASHKAPPSFHDWKALSSQVHRKERRARDVWRCVMTRNQPSVAASFFFFNLFFWLHWVFIDSRGPSLVAAIKSYSLIVVHRLLIAAVPLVLKHTKREMSKYVPTVGTGLQ